MHYIYIYRPFFFCSKKRIEHRLFRDESEKNMVDSLVRKRNSTFTIETVTTAMTAIIQLANQSAVF